MKHLIGIISLNIRQLLPNLFFSVDKSKNNFVECFKRITRNLSRLNIQHI